MAKGRLLMIWQQLKALKSMGLARVIILIISIIFGFISDIYLVSLILDVSIESYDANGIIYTANVFFGFSFVALAVEITLILYCLVSLLFLAVVKLICKNSEMIEKSDDDSQEKKHKLSEYIGAIAILSAIFILFNGAIVWFTANNICIYTQTEIISRSVFNPGGTTYSYDDIQEYSVDDDCNNPVLILKTDDGKTFQIGDSDSSGGTFDDFDEELDALIRIDEILLEKNVAKTVKCTPYDFDYYEQDKAKLDILMSDSKKN